MTIQEYLNENKINLTELSQKTGILISTLSKLRRGQAGLTKKTKQIFYEKLKVEIEESPSREQQLEQKIKELLKNVYKLNDEVYTLKNILMQKDLTISFLAHQLKILNKYSSPKANKEDLYKNYRTLLDKYNKLCYNIDTKEEEDNESD